jgi:hypothetical protein
MVYVHWLWWMVGIVLLLAMCGNDDDEHCYSFGAERLCFDKPLPPNAECFLTSDRRVECLDKPTN